MLFEQVAETGTTLVAVTHDHELLRRFDRVVDFKVFGDDGSAAKGSGTSTQRSNSATEPV
jgi:ABC-type lipoprotein export system ATPase subunit